MATLTFKQSRPHNNWHRFQGYQRRREIIVHAIVIMTRVGWVATKGVVCFVVLYRPTAPTAVVSDRLPPSLAGIVAGLGVSY